MQQISVKIRSPLAHGHFNASCFNGGHLRNALAPQVGKPAMPEAVRSATFVCVLPLIRGEFKAPLTRRKLKTPFLSRELKAPFLRGLGDLQELCILTEKC
ncbi:MAG: hypothetical protein N4J56_006872 [Chroococcidiopsis sp. SAG 2025]|nr:hypothetical protein [Chroococcidiopsis sp. SAG 2025]